MYTGTVGAEKKFLVSDYALSLTGGIKIQLSLQPIKSADGEVLLLLVHKIIQLSCDPGVKLAILEIWSHNQANLL